MENRTQVVLNPEQKLVEKKKKKVFEQRRDDVSRMVEMLHCFQD